MLSIMEREFPEAIVILAGGLGERFGSYKIIYEVDGQALIRRLIRRIQPKEVDTQIYVSVRFDWQERLIRKYVDVDGFIYDVGYLEGPLSGIVSSIERLEDFRYIGFIPGDNLWINYSVIENLFKLVKDGCTVASPIVNRYVETLSMVIDSSWLSFSRELLNLDKPFRPSDIHRSSREAGYIEYYVEGPTDLDTPLRDKSISNNPISIGRIKRISEPQKYYWKAIEALITGRYGDASESFHKEYLLYRESGLKPLDIHAEKDSKEILK